MVPPLPELLVSALPSDGALLSDPIVRKKTTEMTTREHRETDDVEQTEKMIPFVTRKTASSQNVGELVFSVNISDLDLGF